jgi:hypothetical protein
VILVWLFFNLVSHSQKHYPTRIVSVSSLADQWHVVRSVIEHNQDQRQRYCRNNEPAKYICLLRDGELQKPQWKKLLHYMKEKVGAEENEREKRESGFYIISFLLVHILLLYLFFVFYGLFLIARTGALCLCTNSAACSICSITCPRLRSSISMPHPIALFWFWFWLFVVSF